MAINPFIYEQYDRISDIVYYIARNAVLKFSVSLAKYSDKYGRELFHKEFEYNSKNYDQPLITIRREYDYYLSIENARADDISGKREYVRIGVEEFMLFKQALNNAAKWFTDPAYKDLFLVHKNELIMGMKVEKIELPFLPFDKWLSFEPVIYMHNEEATPGIRMCISDVNNFADIYLNRFMGLVYTVNSFNMLLTAQSMLNYIGRPEFGYNLMSFTNERYERRLETGEEKVEAREGRVIPGTSSNAVTDFFSRMKELNDDGK